MWLFRDYICMICGHKDGEHIDNLNSKAHITCSTCEEMGTQTTPPSKPPKCCADIYLEEPCGLYEPILSLIY